MSTEGYAEFLVQMGHQVRRNAGVWWFDVHRHIYMSFPFDQPVDPGHVDRGLVLGRDGWAARFPTAPGLGKPSYRIACRDHGYDLQSLRSKTRNQTRRGLENCTCRFLGWDELETQGIALNIGTLRRQGRVVGPDVETYWKRYFAAAAKAEGAEAWGAFHDGALAAYLIAFVMENTSHVLIVRSDPEKLRFYPNNALLFTYLSESLVRRGLQEVSIGLESIQSGMEGLDRFKQGMGFVKVPIGQRVILKPAARLLTLSPISGLATGLARRLSGAEKADKLSGLLEWYKQQPRLT